MKQLYTIVIVLLYANLLFPSSNLRVGNFPDLKVVDVDGVNHQINQYLDAGKSIILNFSSTWCRPCWNYQNSGTLQHIWSEYGPEGKNNVVVILIEADKNTCEDCLYGPDGCNDFTYGDWSSSYPISNLEDHNESIIKSLKITKFPSIFAISARDASISEVGQLSLSQWESWLEQNQVEQRLDFSKELKKIKQLKITAEEIGDDRNINFNRNILNSSESVGISWNIYPNPCVELLSIKSNRLIQSPVHITIYNNAGNMIYSQHFEFYFQNWTVDMTTIPAGSYFVKIESEHGGITKRIINIR